MIIEAAAKRVSFAKNSFTVYLTDGRALSVPLAYFPRLLRAPAKARLKYTLSGGGTGIHWDALDEDISVKGLLLGIGDQTRSPDTADRSSNGHVPRARRKLK